MKALREIAFDDKEKEYGHNKKISKEKKLQKIFVNQIKNNGRISEMQTALQYKGLLGSAGELSTGLDLLKTGRIKLGYMIKYGITFGKAAEQKMPDKKSREQVKRLMEEFYTTQIKK
jgi:hypothetical protein